MKRKNSKSSKSSGSLNRSQSFESQEGSVGKRKKIDNEKGKFHVSPLEALENDLIEIGEMDVETLVHAGKCIFDSARRCLKGGKKRKVIQIESSDYESAGSGWKVNFRTIMKHIRERAMNASSISEKEVMSEKNLAILKAHLEKQLQNDKSPQAISSLTDLVNSGTNPQVASSILTNLNQLKTVKREISSSKVSHTESQMKKIWDGMSLSRLFPQTEEEMKELQDLEINKFIHFSLPKNEWYFGKFWFNKSRDDIISMLRTRQMGRNNTLSVKRSYSGSSMTPSISSHQNQLNLQSKNLNDEPLIPRNIENG